MVPARTPAAETARLAELFTAISKMDETRAFYERLGAAPMTGGPAQMHDFQRKEIALWKRIVSPGQGAAAIGMDSRGGRG
ncbi:TctC protein [Alicycliphilus sp. B1]|nr:TctC protein [Alicycliphilus sp. B1]